MNEAKRTVVKSADRVLDLFEALVYKGRPLTHTELCNELGVPKSSLSQLMGNLVQRGYVRFHPGPNTYGIGDRLIQLVERQRANTTLPELAQPLCARITRMTGESSSLNLRYDAQSVERVCGANSTQSLTYSMNVGELAPMHAVSSGKVLLAWLSEEELKSYLASAPLKAVTKRTVTSAAALRRELRQVRSEGVAWSVEEYTPGIVGIAVPVLDPAGEPVGAFNVAMPSVRDSPAHRLKLVAALKDAAASLQKDLEAAVHRVTDPSRAALTVKLQRLENE